MHYGHLSYCEDVTKPNIVPVTYVLKNSCIYIYSYLGEKIEAMRRQPKVCFQVEELVNNNSWQSAVIHGTYRELQGEEREQAFTQLMDKFWEAYNKRHSIFFPFRDPEKALGQDDVIVFAIDIESEVGRKQAYDA